MRKRHLRAIGAGRVLADVFGAAELLKIQDLPLGGLVLRAHSGVSDDGHDPSQAEGLAGGFAAVEPPFPRLSSGSSNFQILCLFATTGWYPAENAKLPDTPLGGSPANVPSAGTSKPIKLMVFAWSTRQSGIWGRTKSLETGFSPD
jgi:hypothetical protein